MMTPGELALLQALALKIIRVWERLGRCEDEFLPDYPEACSEDRDWLDKELSELRLLLRQAGLLPPEEPIDGGV